MYEGIPEEIKKITMGGENTYCHGQKNEDDVDNGIDKDKSELNQEFRMDKDWRKKLHVNHHEKVLNITYKYYIIL